MFFLPEEPQEDMVTSPVPTSASPGKAHKEKKLSALRVEKCTPFLFSLFLCLLYPLTLY
jgi:hypothetical protein